MGGAMFTIGAPTAALAPVGCCAFSEEFSSATLKRRQDVSHDVRVFSFALPDPSKPLGLSTCACILAKGGADAEGGPLIRPYTPISTNAMIGEFQLMVKVYDGGLSKHMDGMKVG